MAVLSFHCQNYKKGALNGLDGHNRRLHKNHKSNPDIKTEFSKYNYVYKAPEKSLYADCQKLVQQKVLAHGNKVRKDSNYICECIFSYPSDLPPEQLGKYNRLVIEYMNTRLNENNLLEAVCHVDEGGCPHLHLDYALITSDFRLSSKSLITRNFITSVHDELPKFLQQHGFDIQRGESVPERKAGRSASQYKKDMEQKAKELNAKIKDLETQQSNFETYKATTLKDLQDRETQLKAFSDRATELFLDSQDYLEKCKKLYNLLDSEHKALYKEPLVKLDESLLPHQSRQKQQIKSY